MQLRRNPTPQSRNRRNKTVTKQNEFHNYTRSNWSIMLAGLYADLFKRHPTHATLTRWCDLAEEIQEV